MNKKMEEILKQLSGKVVGIGLSDEFVEIVGQNNQIDNFTLMENNSSKKSGKSGRSKVVHIKKIHKIFKKKKIDFTVVNFNDIEKYIKYFVKNSIFITKKKIYLYGNINQEQINNLLRKYNRYQVKSNLSKFGKKTIIEIDSTNSRNNYFKDKGYLLFDILDELLTILSDVLIK